MRPSTSPMAYYRDLDGKALGEDDVPGLLEDVGDHGLAVPHGADSISDYSDASEDGDESVHSQSEVEGTSGDDAAGVPPAPVHVCALRLVVLIIISWRSRCLH